MSLSREEIKEIIALVDESGWDEAVISIGDVTLALSKSGSDALLRSPQGAPPVATQAAAPAQPAAQAPAVVPPAPSEVSASPRASEPAAPAPDNGIGVTAPSVGVFWRSPEPGAPPFVEVGDTVDKGDPLCIVEIMKLMQHVEAPSAGTITAIHVENGESVEHGTVLFTLAPVES